LESKLPNTRNSSIFESAPLFRIEVELDARTNPFELPFLPDYDGLNTNKGTQALEGAWFKFEVSATHRKGFTPALISRLVRHNFCVCSGNNADTCSRQCSGRNIFVAAFPKISELVFKLLNETRADKLAVYGVGQKRKRFTQCEFTHHLSSAAVAIL
jgi:hypothetical protein